MRVSFLVLVVWIRCWPQRFTYLAVRFTPNFLFPVLPLQHFCLLHRQDFFLAMRQAKLIILKAAHIFISQTGYISFLSKIRNVYWMIWDENVSSPYLCIYKRDACEVRRLSLNISLVSQESNGPSDAYAAISSADRLQAEPESLRKWREEQGERLELLGKPRRDRPPATVFTGPSASSLLYR